MAIKSIQAMYRGIRVSRPTVNLIYIFLEEDCTIQEIAFYFRTLMQIGTTTLQVYKNGIALYATEDRPVIEPGSLIFNFPLDTPVAGNEGDIITLDSILVGAAGLSSPFSMKVKYTNNEFTEEVIQHITASLANNAVESGEFVGAKAFLLKKIEVSRHARVRLYKTAAARDADVARPFGDTSYIGTEHGMLADILFNVTTGLEWMMSPDAVCANGDEPSEATIYYTIQNTSGGTGTVVLDLTTTILEV